MHRLSWLITVPVAVLAVCFALGNRAPTFINLWPLGYELALPIYLLALAPLALGLVLGGLLIWFRAVRHKLAAKRLGKEVGKLRDEISDLRQQLAAKQTTPTTAKKNWHLPTLWN